MLKGLPSASGRQWSWINCAGWKRWLSLCESFWRCRKFGLSQQDIYKQLTLTIYLKGMFNMDTIMSIRMEEGTQNVPEIYKWVHFQFLAEYDVEMYLYHIISEKLILSSQTALKQMGTGVYSIKKEIKGKLFLFLKKKVKVTFVDTGPISS